MHEAVTYFLIGFLLVAGGMAAYWTMKNIVDGLIELADRFKFWYWRIKKSR